MVLMKFIVKGGEISTTYSHHIFTQFFFCVLIFGSFVDLQLFHFFFLFKTLKI